MKWPSIIVLALVSGCASEPIMGHYAYLSETATLEQLDAATGKAAVELGYIPVRRVVVGSYRSRAVAEGDARWVKAESRARAKVVWAHTVPSPEGKGVELRLDVLSSAGILDNGGLAADFAAAVGRQVRDLDPRGGVCTGLGYDPAAEPTSLEVK